MSDHRPGYERIGNSWRRVSDTAMADVARRNDAEFRAEAGSDEAFIATHVPSVEEAVSGPEPVDIDKMTKQELVDFASEHEIDVDEGSKKDDIRDHIHAVMDTAGE